MAHRTQITLTDQQYGALKRTSERTGLSLAELTRRALASAYRLPTATAADAIEESFGAWGDREGDGADFVEGIRPGLDDPYGEAK